MKSYILLGKARHKPLSILAVVRTIEEITEDAAVFRANEGWKTMYVIGISASGEGLGPHAVLSKIKITPTITVETIPLP